MPRSALEKLIDDTQASKGFHHIQLLKICSLSASAHFPYRAHTRYKYPAPQTPRKRPQKTATYRSNYDLNQYCLMALLLS